MNGYGDYERNPMRNGGQPVIGGYDPYNRRDDFMRDEFTEFNSPRRSNYGGSVFANSDFPTARSDYPTYRDDPYSDRIDYGRSRNGFGPDLDRNSIDGRFEMRDNDPIFELDHLATYSSSKSGLMHAEDGLRKLRQMESTTGIWTMRCSMVVERRFLVIIDKGNGEELERFPLELVHEPTAIFKDDKREIYTNLILFTVLDDPRKRNAQADMHIFQSITAPAQEIVDEVQAAKEGRGRIGSGQRIPPPPMGPAPDPPRIGEDHIIQPPVLGLENLGFDDEGSRWIGQRGSKSRFSYGLAEANNFGQRHNRDGFSSKFSETNNFDRGHGHERFSKPVMRSNLESHQIRDRDYHMTSVNDDDMYNMRMSQRPGGFGGGMGATNRASFIPRDNDIDSGQNEALERDVQLLNSCFDDIEKFVSRLQQAAEAYKELERRRRDRSAKKSKNKQSGDGMLNMRARPPPANDFIDIFEKFKFAFNLLAKLKAHIHDPNAPELVHFLFTPLSLIFEASRDPVHGGKDLAAEAYKPTITSEARQLLLNCLTSKELELWQALGKSWTTSNEEQRGYGGQYVPRFYNGWKPSPQPPVDDTRDRIATAFNNHRSQIENREREDQARREASSLIQPYPSNDRENDSRFAKSQGYNVYREPDRDDLNPYARSTKHPSTPPSGAVINPNVADYREHVERHIDRNIDMQKPPQSQPRSKQDEMIQFAQDVSRSNGKVMEVVHERNGRNNKEITVDKGDLLQVLDDSRNWWKLKNCNGDIGYAPYTILKEYQVSDYDTDKTRGLRLSGEYNSQIPVNGLSSSNHIPPPPPPPPVPVQQKRQEDYSPRDFGLPPFDDPRDDYRDERHTPRQMMGNQFDNSDGHYSSDSDRGHRSRRNHSKKDYQKNHRYDDSDDGSFDSLEHDRRGYREKDKKGARKNSSRRENYSENRWREPTPPLKKDRNRDEGRKTSPNSQNNRPLPPPPPLTKPPALRKPRDNAPKDRFQDELTKKVGKNSGSNMALTPKQQRPGTTNRINTTSSSDDVADWLVAKNFTQRTINILCAYNGEDLFRMKRREMDRLLGSEEAQRLDSLVTVQKIKSGYGTKSAAELNAILQKRKARSDGSNNDERMGSPPSFSPDMPDYSDSDSESDQSDDFGNAGKTLRALLQQQRRRITSKVYQQ